MKASHEQYDDRVIECWWDEERDSFRFMRFRDDKHNGNHISVVKKIIESIRDGVQLETVSRLCGSPQPRVNMRSPCSCWKHARTSEQDGKNEKRWQKRPDRH